MKVQRLKVETEAQFQQVQDQMYQEARNGKRNFYGLLELVTNPVTIMTAMHRVKANTGRNTPGSDGKRMRDILSMDYGEVMQRVQAEKTSNLPVRHTGHKTRVYFLEFEGCVIGLTHVGFSTYEAPPPKNPKETPFSEEGRALWEKRAAQKLSKMRPDSITMLDDLTIWASENKHGSASMEKRNFEYYMNRGYALNRDHCRCKVCATPLLRGNLHTHHKNPFLPIDQINKVNNLASLCMSCHDLVHSDKPNPFGKGTKPFTKLEAYRKEVKAAF